jgi:hypothetical protein
MQGQTTVSHWTPQSVSLDTTSQRPKNLNFYYDFDLDALVGKRGATPRK